MENRILNSEREFLPDIIKAFAIFLVVWGHTVQHFHGISYDFWSDYIYKTIYSFHMPLFAIISGYLFAGTLRRHDTKFIIKKRFVQLIVPCISWPIILTFCELIISFALHREKSLLFWIKAPIWGVISIFWFLKAIFICTLIVLLIEKKFNGNIYLYIIASALTIFATETYSIDVMAFMLPYFTMGLLYGKSHSKIHINKITTILNAILYAVLLVFFKNEHYIYVTHLSILESPNIYLQLSYDLYRYITGLAGSVFVIGFFELIQKRLSYVSIFNIEKLSKNTGNIYIISTLLFTYLKRAIRSTDLNMYFISFFNNIIYDFVVLIPISIFIIWICIKLTHILPNKIRKILLGL